METRTHSVTRSESLTLFTSSGLVRETKLGFIPSLLIAIEHQISIISQLVSLTRKMDLDREKYLIRQMSVFARTMEYVAFTDGRLNRPVKT